MLDKYHKNTRSLTMKQLLLFTITFLSLCGSCRKNRQTNPIEQLPPETTTGANTFGCLVDGKVFKPKGNPLAGPIIKAQYQFVDGKQGFGISAKRSDGDIRDGLGIAGDSVQVYVGIFELAEVRVGRFVGGYTYSDLNTIPGIQYGTTEINRGQLIITKFDTVSQIVSGRFWFDAKNSNGQIVQVREGRFDLPYVR